MRRRGSRTDTYALAIPDTHAFAVFKLNCGHVLELSRGTIKFIGPASTANGHFDHLA
jgi:hypothetical protein